jgi:selenium metabolism protein YedF
MKIVDTRGELCPAPLIATKRALKDLPDGDSISVLTDNVTSFNNVSRYLRDNKTPFTVTEGGGVWTLIVTRSGVFDESVKAEDYCVPDVPHFTKGDFVVVISSDKMGDGDAELGQLLMGNFIKALKDLDTLPKKILFYNKGVTLAITDSPLINHIQDLEKMGVEILLCATCVNHYKIAEKTGAGILSNMFVIAEAMANAGNVVKP